MPDVTVRNETNIPLHIAFRFVAPASWTNHLAPGAPWTTHLASVAYTIEVRLNNGGNEFSAETSWAAAADISGGWLAGAASVTLGTLSLGGIMAGLTGGAAFAATGPLMKHAIEAGQRFGQNADGMVVTVPGVWIPFCNKTYAVRFEEASGYSLWDVDQNVKL